MTIPQKTTPRQKPSRRMTRGIDADHFPHAMRSLEHVAQSPYTHAGQSFSGFFLLIVVGAILPAVIFVIWLPSFVAQTVNLSNMVHESRAESIYQLVHTSMKLPRMFSHGFSSYTDTQTVTFGNTTDELERRWKSVWNAFSKSMYEWDYHVHYTYYTVPQDTDSWMRMVGVMGGSWQKHQIKPEYAIPPPLGSEPEHNSGFDHAKILRYHAGWGNESPTRLLGQNVINATTGQVTSWTTLNVTYDGGTNQYDIVRNTPLQYGWMSTSLWHCQSVAHTCMQMTGYFEKEFDSDGNLRGWHYIAYETPGFYSSFEDISKGNGITFLMEKASKKLLAVGSEQKTYYQKEDGSLAIHTYDTFPDSLVNVAGLRVIENVDHSIVNLPQQMGLTHRGKRYNVDAYYYEDGFGIQWYIISVTDEVESVAVPVVLGTMTGLASFIFIFLFILFGCLACLTVRRNMVSIIKNLRHIELMQLKEVRLRKPYTSEFAQITTALHHLKNRMQEYRAFLPNSILEASTTGSEINEVTTDDDTVSLSSNEDDDKKSQIAQETKKKRLSVQKKYIGSRTELDELGKSSFGFHNRDSLNASMDPRFNCNLQVRPMTLLVVEIHNVDVVLECLDWNQFTFQHGEYLASMTKISSAHKGSLDYFSHKYYGYYFKSPVLAAKAALKMEKRLNQLNQVGMEDYSNVPFLFSIGVATGETFIGTLGNQRMKNKIIFGESKKRAENLSKANQKWQTSVLCDQSTRHAIRDIVMTRPVTQIEMSLGRVDAFEVIEVIQHVQDEWMYEIQHELHNKRFELYEEGYKHLVANNLEEALRLFLQFRKDNPQDKVVGKMISSCNAQLIQARARRL
uniref:Guanylate cyclase domain-containing protein n=1 Tax=Percolomonas cosmopolitus TaxID=63605 RepID=A0A7S1KKP7_9EUKA|mmetsp:Transcript_10055/g.37493  ORF Transcript_10055/g.37493 Transcript_10055/m.37493 type:complete len:848 (+) Transcript_10055:911-3454(+)